MGGQYSRGVSRQFSRRDWLRLAGVGIAASRLGAWQDATFSTGVAVVDVFATVRDRDGKLVTDLTREDFELKEDGREQEIRYFSARTDVPLTLGLLFDLSGSQRSVIAEQREAARDFLREVVQSESTSENEDEVFLVGFNRSVGLALEPTTDVAEIDRGLDALEVPTKPNGDLEPIAEGTALFDAVRGASGVLGELSGRKTIAVISDGVDTASQSDVDGAIEAALRADVMVYPIRVFDQDVFRFNIPGPARNNLRRGEKALKKLAEKTGGAVFDIAGATSLEDGFRLLNEELRSQYSLGYTSNAGERGKRGYREIRVKVPKGLKVQARDGYYAAE